MISLEPGALQSIGPTIFFLLFSPKVVSALVNFISVSFLISPPVNNSRGINLSFADDVFIKEKKIIMKNIFFINFDIYAPFIIIPLATALSKRICFTG